MLNIPAVCIIVGIATTACVVVTAGVSIFLFFPYLIDWSPQKNPILLGPSRTPSLTPSVTATSRHTKPRLRRWDRSADSLSLLHNAIFDTNYEGFLPPSLSVFLCKYVTRSFFPPKLCRVGWRSLSLSLHSLVGKISFSLASPPHGAMLSVGSTLTLFSLFRSCVCFSGAQKTFMGADRASARCCAGIQSERRRRTVLFFPPSLTYADDGGRIWEEEEEEEEERLETSLLLPLEACKTRRKRRGMLAVCRIRKVR